MGALFIGSYPNPVEPHRSVFFRELIYQMAKQGMDCTVITPVSVSKYRSRVKDIPIRTFEEVCTGVCVEVFRPRTVSFSAKKIGRWNTIHMTLAAYDRAVMRQLQKIDKTYDFAYGHFFWAAA